jgi:hypothetical protein
VGSGDVGVVGCVLFVAGEEENLEEILESHEFRREIGDGGCFPTLPFSVAVFSDDALRAKLGLGVGIGLGLEGASTGLPLPLLFGLPFPFVFPFCANFCSLSGFVTTVGDSGLEL